MSTESDNISDFSEALALSSLYNKISEYLSKSQHLGELRQIDQEVGTILTSEEYMCYRRYKEYCLQELSELNQTPGMNGSLCSAIERGFIIGYWLGARRREEQAQPRRVAEA
ncbi:MAG TPA: hypothetical protein VH186_18440 [Chloroflexia bacterium]|nr:hypothetical protein [Chloroflexia bacterium]